MTDKTGKGVDDYKFSPMNILKTGAENSSMKSSYKRSSQLSRKRSSAGSRHRNEENDDSQFDTDRTRSKFDLPAYKIPKHLRRKSKPPRQFDAFDRPQMKLSNISNIRGRSIQPTLSK